MMEDESATTGMAPDLSNGSGSWTTNGTTPPDAPVAEAIDASDAITTSDEDGAAFLADLARAMQTTAGAERLRVTDETERRRKAHLDKIRARETSESEALGEAAENDVKGIDAWADAEIDRIQRERDRRILARRRDLEISVENHRSLIGREIDAVEAAIVSYRGELESFFGRLEAEIDPISIARQAGTRPVFPALEAIGGDGVPAAIKSSSEDASDADDEPPTGGSGEGEPATAIGADEEVPVVGVMDANPSEEPATVEVRADQLIGEEQPAGEGQQVEAAVASPVTPRSSAALLQAVPSLRPMSWFHRDHASRTGDEQSG